MKDEKITKYQLREELADFLITISVISKQIAMKLYERNMSNEEEGEK